MERLKAEGQNTPADVLLIGPGYKAFASWPDALPARKNSGADPNGTD